MNAGRDVAILKLVTVLRELPDDATVLVSAFGLSREEYGRFPGGRDRSSEGSWSKEYELGGGVKLELYTSEPSFLFPFPPRPPELRLVGGDRG